MIPFVDLQAQRRRIDDVIERRISAVLAHGQFIMGPEVGEVEAALAERAGVDHVVSCASGTDALVMSLMALGAGAGDAVLVPTFTFVATAEAVVLAGATPVFCDVRRGTFNLDPTGLAEAVEAAEQRGLRPVGVIAVDLFGQPAEYEQIVEWASGAGLWVLADAAQSFGGSVESRPVGSLAPISATSFFPAKPLGCYGDGGAVFTTEPGLAETIRSIREHGQGSDRYHAARVGLTGRLDTIQAAVLLAKLEIFDDELAQRRQLAATYDESLREHVATPVVLPSVQSAWAQYTVRVRDRDTVADTLSAAGIPTAVYYPVPLHLQKPYELMPRSRATLEVADQLAREVLSIPIHPYLGADVRDRIIDVLREAVAAGAPAS